MQVSRFFVRTYPHIRHCDEKKAEEKIDAPGNMSDVFNRDLAHSGRFLFGPILTCLPSARHWWQVCGFLRSNVPLDEFGRNCVRGKARSQAWQVIGLAAASMELCLFLAI